MSPLPRALSAELLKLRGTLAAWMCLIAPATVVALYVLQVSFSKIVPGSADNSAESWFFLTQSILVLWSFLMLPLFVTLQSALLAGLEHGDGQWKHGSATVPDVGARLYASFDAARAALLPDANVRG